MDILGHQVQVVWTLLRWCESKVLIELDCLLSLCMDACARNAMTASNSIQFLMPPKPILQLFGVSGRHLGWTGI